MFWKKKKKDDDHLDVLDEIKEPFNMQRFIDTHIVARYNKFRKMLDEHGILFFLLSPFQYRNRLLIKIGIIIIGVLIGLVPRSMGLIDETKDRNSASELAQIEGSEFRSGLISVRPLESSHHDEQHLIVFEINGDTVAGVPSTADKYQVELRPDRGVSYAEDVSYSYDIIPVSNSKRLLVMYVDNRKQDDETGIYSLHIRVKGDTIKHPNNMSIVLSDYQETTDLFNSKGIDLARLTNKIEPGNQDAIFKGDAKLDQLLEGYELMDERLSIEGMIPEISHKDMLAYVKENTVLGDIADDSTVRDIKRDSETYKDEDGTGRGSYLIQYASINYNDVVYALSDKEIPENIEVELEALQGITDDINSELSALNRYRAVKYNVLVDLQSVLNREVDVTKFAVTDLRIVERSDDAGGTHPKNKLLSDEILSDEEFIDKD